MSKVQVDTIDTRSGTSTMQIGSTNTSTINIGVSGDTVNIPAGVTIANAGTATGFGGNNTPSFSAKLSSDQSCANGAETVLAFATEQWDSNSTYNNSTYRFTPAVAGKYVINGLAMLNDITIQNKRLQLLIYKNGTFFADVETIASSEGSTDPLAQL